MTYNILNDTFCYYCQKEFKSPAKLQRHILTQHPNTYASNAVLDAREERDSKGKV